ncbi:hypothetical protein O181_011506 [Austropuccinia psidii MF-1]|uniref:Retrotransposon gag domain-containing protein n=1 Tax=Austropuccinia psidii MF-1 TaxID=1389203 RepID=A0A9Q3GLE1_9BASI|nr:hypothetical protein [Austropuccinia psidii MF-1]
MDKIVKALQEGQAQLGKASEETKKRVNLVFEEQNHSKRDRDCLDQGINKPFNVHHNLNPQPHGHVMDNPYHQDDIDSDAMLMKKARSPSQYQDGDNMSYLEKEALKPLPEASSRPKFSGTGEYDHMKLINYIDGLFIDVPSIPDYWITARLNTVFKGHASIWYTEMKEIHGRRNWPWWKSQIIQNYSKGTWIWKRTISFENDKYSLEKDPYGFCLRQSKRLKAIDPQINIQMRNQKLMTKMPGELQHAVKYRCHLNFTLDEIANTLQDVRKRTNTWKYSQYESSCFKEKQPFRVEFKDKPRERMAELAKMKNSSHNFSSTDHYSNDCPKAKEKVYAKKGPEERAPTEHSESESMADAIREQSDHDQDPREELLVEYQEETPLEIQDIYLKAGMPQDTANKNLCKHKKDAQTSLVISNQGMAYIHGRATKITDPLEELLNEFREGQFSTTLTSKQKLSLLKMLMKNKPAFANGEEPLGKIRGHDIDLYVDVEIPYPPVLRRPPYPASLGTRKEIEKHINELLDMDFIRNIGHNEIVEFTSPVLITWHDGKSRLCRDFRALNNYTKADRYPIPRIPHALEELAKAK